MSVTPPVRILPPEWCYARLQAIGRAQSRYLLLLVIGSAYTVAEHLTGGPSVQVPFLGLNVDRQLVEAFAVTVLAIIALALFGTGEALQLAHQEVARSLGKSTRTLPLGRVDPEPNVLDFLVYAALLEGKPVPVLAVAGWAFLYALPLLAALTWAVALWWSGAHARVHPPWWLRGVDVLNAVLLLAAYARGFFFVRRRWKVLLVQLDREQAERKAADP